MSDMIMFLQNFDRLGVCTERANELYNRLITSGDEAVYVVNELNNKKFKIFVAKVKLFLKRLQGDKDVNTTEYLRKTKPKESFTNSFKDVFLAKDKLVDSARQVSQSIGTRKYTITLVLVCIPYTGCFGIHDFYLGKTMSGVIKLFTINFFTIGWIIDIFRIVTKNYTDSYGNKLQ